MDIYCIEMCLELWKPACEVLVTCAHCELGSQLPPSSTVKSNLRLAHAADLKARRGAHLIGEDLTRLCQTHSTPFSPPPVSLPPSLLPLCHLRRWEGRGEGLRWSKSDCAAHQSCEMDLGHTPLTWRSCAEVRLRPVHETRAQCV